MAQLVSLIVTMKVSKRTVMSLDETTLGDIEKLKQHLYVRTGFALSTSALVRRLVNGFADSFDEHGNNRAFDGFIGIGDA